MFRSTYFLSKLLLAMAAVSLPLLSLYGYSLLRGFQEAQVAANQSLSDTSREAVRVLGVSFSHTEEILRAMSLEQDFRAGNATACSRLLSIVEFEPLYVNAILVNADGKALCESRPAGLHRYEPEVEGQWLTETRRVSTARFSGVLESTWAPKAGLALSFPLNAGGRGVLALYLELGALSEVLPAAGLPAGGTITLLDARDRVVARRPDSRQYVGKLLPPGARNVRPTMPGEVRVVTGIDGVSRVYGGHAMPRHDLRVVAGIPEESIYEHARIRLTQGLVAVSAVLALGLLLAWVLARRLAWPAASLHRATQALAEGKQSRADENLPGEFSQVACELNKLVDLNTKNEAELRAVNLQVGRLADFYAARTAASGAVFHAQSEQQLFDEVCDICVRHSPASMAWVGVLDNGTVRPVAWGGDARRYTDSISVYLELPAGKRSPAMVALGRDNPVISNDVQFDQGMPTWREQAFQFGVRGAATFPFRRKGEPYGVLNLYVTEPGMFDTELVKLLSGLAADICFGLDRLDREAARQQAEDQLVNEKKRVTAIVESALDAIVTVDEKGHVVVFNEAAELLFGVISVQALGEPISRFIKEAQSAADEDWSAALHPGVSELTGLRMGREPVLLEASVAISATEPQTLTTAFLRDKTAASEAEQAKAEARMAAAASDAKTRFLSQMSHELRTPLNAVLGYSQLLRNSLETKLTDRDQRHLDQVYTSANQLRALIDDVLDLSRVETGKFRLQLSDVDGLSLIRSVMKMLDPQASQAEVILVHTSVMAHSILVHADEIRLRQVLLNVVGNAIKYNHSGGSVEVALELVDGNARFTVKDTGRGMSEAQQLGLFQHFNRLGLETSGVPGTGVGLALSKQLMGLMGGSIAVTSKEGVGTTVVIEAPNARAEARDNVSTSRPLAKLSQAPAAAAPSGHILYIEDNDLNADLIREILRDWPDVRLQVETTGESGVHAALREAHDLILLDMQLPDISGLLVLDQLKNGRAVNCPIVALSASAMPSEMEEAKRRGAHAYWTKPVDFNQVLGGIRDILGGGRKVTDQSQDERNA